MPARKGLTEQQKKHETNRNHSAMFRVFYCDDATDEDRQRARQGIEVFCKANREPQAGEVSQFLNDPSISALIGLVRRDGKREVYLAWMNSINQGREVVNDAGLIEVAEGGGEK